MKFVFFFIVLVVIGAKAKPRAQTAISGGGDISGGVQFGGCSIGAGVGGSANGQLSGADAQPQAQAGGSAEGNVQVEGCSPGAEVEGSSNDNTAGSGAQLTAEANPSAEGSVSGGELPNGVEGSANANVEVGGCSLEAGVEGSADGNAAGGGAQLSAPGCNNTPKGFTYTINVIRGRTVLFKRQEVIYYEQHANSSDKITYSAKIDDEHPLTLNTDVQLSWSTIYKSDRDNMTNACNDPVDGTWDYVAVKVIQETAMPAGGCPFDEGKYDLNRKASVTVTFPEMISCGDYNLWTDLCRDGKVRTTLGYEFTIENDGNCKS